jgi:hypothetical protein
MTEEDYMLVLAFANIAAPNSREAIMDRLDITEEEFNRVTKLINTTLWDVGGHWSGLVV